MKRVYLISVVTILLLSGFYIVYKHSVQNATIKTLSDVDMEKLKNSPYSLFGDTTRVLKTEFEEDRKFELVVVNKNKQDEISRIIFKFNEGIAILFDKQNKEINRIEIQPEEYSIFISTDRYSDKYPSFSPYHYTKNNPINLIDINGDSTWVTQTDQSITINTTIEFSGNALYKKNGEMRKGAQDRIDAIKADIMETWNGTEYEGKEVNVNLITISSASGGTEKSYDQINVTRGGGRSFVNITDQSGNRISSTDGRGITKLVNDIRTGNGDYNVSGTFYTNTQSGTYAHEYGHMTGYFSEDYKYENGVRIPSKEYPGVRNSIMYSTFGKPNSVVLNMVINMNSKH